MPRYFYECGECKEGFDVHHSINDEWEECIKCGSTELTRVPSMPITFTNKREKVNKTGELVENFIEESKEALKQEKKEAMSGEYKA
jgi:putative FmdB family regulatory protein